MEAFLGLIILSTIILLGTFGELFFKKTGIPDVLWLILFGFLITHIFKVISPNLFDAVLPVFMAITLIIILFEGGLHLNLGGVIKYSLAGMGLALLTFILTTATVAIITMGLYFIGVLANWNWWSGIILGAIVGGTSSIVVMPLLKIAKLGDDKTNMLSVESAFTDAICVVVVMTILGYLATTGQSLKVILQGVSASLAIGIVIGTIIGFLWLFVLYKLKTHKDYIQYFYFLTLALLIFLYVFVEYIGGSAVVAIFIFGLIMGNSQLLNKIFKLELYRLDKDILLMNSQLAFLIKSFFFVIMGVLLRISLIPFLIALGIAILLLGVRYLVIITIPSTRKLEKKERKLLYFFAPKGLAAGILAIAVSEKTYIAGAKLFVDVVFGIIIFSILLSTFGLYMYKNKWSKEEKEESKTKNKKEENKIKKVI